MATPVLLKLSKMKKLRINNIISIVVSIWSLLSMGVWMGLLTVWRLLLGVLLVGRNLIRLLPLDCQWLLVMELGWGWGIIWARNRRNSLFWLRSKGNSGRLITSYKRRKARLLRFIRKKAIHKLTLGKNDHIL